MTKGQYPTINNGLGNLTPQLWRRLMTMLEKFEQKDRDEQRQKTNATTVAKPFLVKLDKAKCIAPNRYKYSWTEVYLKDDDTIGTVTDGRTSTGDSDEWDYAAINVIEAVNLSTYTSAGVNMSSSYPSGWTMQAFGGGSCSGTDCEVTLDGNAVVILNKIGGRSTESVQRYIFSAVNEHDGSCPSTAITISDPIGSVPTVPDGADYGFIYINASGVPAFKDKDDNIVTFDVS